MRPTRTTGAAPVVALWWKRWSVTHLSCHRFLVHRREELEHPPMLTSTSRCIMAHHTACSSSIPSSSFLRVSRMESPTGRASTGSVEAAAVGSMWWRRWRLMGEAWHRLLGSPLETKVSESDVYFPIETCCVFWVSGFHLHGWR
jgi:hypothetical protein